MAIDEAVKEFEDSWKWSRSKKKCIDCNKRLMYKSVTSYTKKCANCGRIEY